MDIASKGLWSGALYILTGVYVMGYTYAYEEQPDVHGHLEHAFMPSLHTFIPATGAAGWPHASLHPDTDFRYNLAYTDPRN